MSVDKFGRFLQRKRKASELDHTGRGLALTPTGDYNIENRRIKYVNDPIDVGDAVNLATLQKHCLPIIGNEINAESKRLTNLQSPENYSDAATKGYVDEAIPFKKSTGIMSYSLGQYKLTDLGYPSSDGDAANVKYVKNLCLTVVSDTHVNGKDMIIQNVRAPIKPFDVANKFYVDNKIIPLTSEGYHLEHHKLTGVKDPVLKTDAVSLGYLKSNALCKKGKVFDGEKTVISNIGQPVNVDDAVSKRYLKEVLSNLGFSLYRKLHQGRTAMHEEESWKEKVLEKSWEELFDL